MQNSASEAGIYLFEHGLRMATVVIATLPIICVYPFLQKYFVKGVMIGSVKG
jgi:putative aldouronate transport system permease protein